MSLPSAWNVILTSYSVSFLCRCSGSHAIWWTVLSCLDEKTHCLKWQMHCSKWKNTLFERKVRHSINKCTIWNNKMCHSKQKMLQLASSFALTWTCVTWCEQNLLVRWRSPGMHNGVFIGVVVHSGSLSCETSTKGNLVGDHKLMLVAFEALFHKAS